MVSALTSIYTQRCVKHTVAMTGEITLRGLVLPVGGIKEKVLAAKRAGVEKVVLPEKNKKDIVEIKESAIEGLEVAYVSRITELMDHVLESEPRTDPTALFDLSEREKHLLSGASLPNSSVEGETVMN
jgi:ATP-dependent Lon protease